MAEMKRDSIKRAMPVAALLGLLGLASVVGVSNAPTVGRLQRGGGHRGSGAHTRRRLGNWGTTSNGDLLIADAARWQAMEREKRKEAMRAAGWIHGRWARRERG